MFWALYVTQHPNKFTIRSTMFPQRNINTFTSRYHEGKTHQIDHILVRFAGVLDFVYPPGLKN
jgi:hypothetical protein